MSLVAFIVGRLSLEGKRVVWVLRALLMDDLIRSPILHHLLVCGADREFSSLLGHLRGLSLLRGDLVTLVCQLVLRNLFHMMRIDDLVLFLNIEWFELG